MKTLFTILLILLPAFAYLQNLVPNGDFESHSSLPRHYNLENSIDKDLDDWYCPIDATPDYFHTGAAIMVHVPNNFIGYQQPHSGEAYVGMILMVNEGSEYLQTPLKYTLKKDSLYCLSLYISLANKSTHKVDQIGFYLSEKSFSVAGWRVLLGKEPQVVNPKGRMLDDTSGWMLVKGLYLAKGNENFLTIGNYSNLHNSNYTVTNTKRYYYPFKGNSYYYIDDVSIVSYDQNNKTVCNFDDFTKIEKLKPSYTIVEDDTIILKNLLFKSDKFEQSPEVFKELFPLVVYMRSQPKVNIDIYGHTDNTGNHDYNVKLSERRSVCVSSFLIKHGIDPSRIHTYGYGPDKPIATNDTEEGKQLNRRVEFKLFYP